MTPSDHIELSLAKIRVIFSDVSDYIEKMTPGQRVPATVLAAEIAKKHNMTGAQLYPVLQFVFKDFPGTIKRAGVKGGIEKL